MSKTYKPPKVTPHGNKFEVQYRISGVKNPVHDSFDTEDAAQTRALEVAYLKSLGMLTPPQEPKNPLMRSALEAKSKSLTLGELMDAYLAGQGPLMEAGCYTATEKRIQRYIIPTIGDIPVAELTAALLNDYYQRLAQTEICEQKGKEAHLIGHSTIEKCRADIRAAINWGMDSELIQQGYNSAARSKLPWSKDEDERGEDYISWDYSEFLHALDICKDKVLRLVILMCVTCTMRIGELLALDWAHVGMTEDGSAEESIYIEYQLQRADEEHLNRSTKTHASFVFPKQRANSKSVLFLTDPKKGSKRHVPYGGTVAEALEAHKAHQQLEKALMGDDYQDYGLVLAQSNGRPYEAKTICNKLERFCEENSLPGICTHSLRHTSVDLKLELSGGDIKAVMADGGYRTDKMVTIQYAALRERRRNRTACRMDDLLTRREMPDSLVVG